MHLSNVKVKLIRIAGFKIAPTVDRSGCLNTWDIPGA